MIKATTKATTVYFCTYCNKETGGKWRRSPETPSIDVLLYRMKQYLTMWPNTQVTFQTRIVYTTEQP